MLNEVTQLSGCAMLSIVPISEIFRCAQDDHAVE
jgi:hypothetical protein